MPSIHLFLALILLHQLDTNLIKYLISTLSGTIYSVVPTLLLLTVSFLNVEAQV